MATLRLDLEERLFFRVDEFAEAPFKVIYTEPDHTSAEVVDARGESPVTTAFGERHLAPGDAWSVAEKLNALWKRIRNQ